MSLIVLTSQDDWTAYLRHFEQADVSYAKEYVSLYADREGGVPEAVFFSEGDCRIFYPYLVRSLDALLPGYADIVSIGYGGPHVVPKTAGTESFSAQFSAYCRSQNYVTETVRFHPLEKNAERFREQMRLDLVRTTVAVDVRPPLAQIRADYSQNVRRNLKKAAANQVSIVEASDRDGLQAFLPLYRETMERNCAAPSYSYEAEFFTGLLKETALCKPRLLLAMHEGAAVAGAIMLSGARFAHYQLGASRKADMPLGINHLLFDAMIQRAKEDGQEYLLLGGGNRDGDGLFRFKASFSKTGHYPYWMGKRVHDPAAYRLLCEKNQANRAGDGAFFPAYRA
ncbi:GNAT family N-acetyltransferase [Brevibacillus sp. SAFN-007a]|uniref:GNAT family N-acetyltransferase n=1 Tax=Brevibacillus sp. SAFN-007a TaxID=3436862 RepID=UPI003F7F742F